MTEAPKLPKLPTPVAHVHSDGDLCWEINPAAVIAIWPCDVFTAAQFIAGMAQAAREERERDAAIASAHSKEPLHPDVPFSDQDIEVTRIAHWQAQNIAAAIRSQPEPTP